VIADGALTGARRAANTVTAASDTRGQDRPVVVNRTIASAAAVSVALGTRARTCE